MAAHQATDHPREGVVRLQQIIPRSWIRYLTDGPRAIDDRRPRHLTELHPVRGTSILLPSLPPIRRSSVQCVGAARSDQTHRRTDPPRSPYAAFLYDQVFAQEPGAAVGAPYHQDHPYLPITGEHCLRIWVPLDPVTAEGGAVRYLKGSHRGPIYRPRSFSGNPNIIALYAKSPYLEAPDFTNYGDDAWFVGEAQPGDALLHHPKTVHGSPPNNTQRFRRAATTMFVGDDVVWDPRPGTAFDHMGSIGAFHVPSMTAGEPIDGQLFPVVARCTT